MTPAIAMKQLVDLIEKMKEERQCSRVLIMWLYDKLMDYMSGSGSTEEDDKNMASIRDLIQEWKK